MSIFFGLLGTCIAILGKKISLYLENNNNPVEIVHFVKKARYCIMELKTRLTNTTKGNLYCIHNATGFNNLLFGIHGCQCLLKIFSSIYGDDDTPKHVKLISNNIIVYSQDFVDDDDQDLKNFFNDIEYIFFEELHIEVITIEYNNLSETKSY